MFSQNRMRGVAAAFALAMTLVVGVVTTGTAGAANATTVRDDAVAWLAPQVTADGALISPYTDAPDPSMTAQAALALAGAGVEADTVARMVGYLGSHVEDFVAPGGSADSPGALGWLILVAVATDHDPRDFGGVDLVERLGATQQADGLFGAGDPTYDGAFRQSLALIALSAVGDASPTGLAWLIDQQCADGGFVAYRPDTSVPCPAVDPSTFSGPDTNSTALAAMALGILGRSGPASSAMSWLNGVRTPGGGFAYLGDSTLTQDANSTGLVALAFRTVDGTEDAGSVAALASLQVPASGDPADAGGIAFQSSDPLYPDLMATTQALLGLAGQAFPFTPADAPTPPSVTPTTALRGSSTTVAPGDTSAPPATPVSASPAYTG